MIEFNEKFMDEEEYKKFYPELCDFLEVRLSGIDYEIVFSPMICIEGLPIIEVRIKQRGSYDALEQDGFFYSDEVKDFAAEKAKQFGDFSIRFYRDKVEDESDVELGDLVLIASQFGKDNVGVVTAVVNRGDEVVYGCSYLEMSYSNFIHTHRDSIFRVSEENYGGYHKGFVKKLTREEALEILSGEAKDNYEKELEGVKERYKDGLECAEKFVRALGSDKTFTTQSRRLKIDGYYGDSIHESLSCEEY